MIIAAWQTNTLSLSHFLALVFNHFLSESAPYVATSYQVARRGLCHYPQSHEMSALCILSPVAQVAGRRHRPYWQGPLSAPQPQCGDRLMCHKARGVSGNVGHLPDPSWNTDQMLWCTFDSDSACKTLQGNESEGWHAAAEVESQGPSQPRVHHTTVSLAPVGELVPEHVQPDPKAISGKDEI